MLCTVTDGVADLRLNRPDKRNTLNDELFAALRTTVIETLPAIDGLRAVIVSGNGEAFCAGRDTRARCDRPAVLRAPRTMRPARASRWWPR